MFSAPQECSHHPDTVNDQLQTKKRDVRVHVSSLDAGNHHQRGQKQHGASGKTSARGRRAWPPILAPSLTRTHLSQGVPSVPFSATFSAQYLSSPDTLYPDFHLFPVCVCLRCERFKGWNFILLCLQAPTTMSGIVGSWQMCVVCSKLLI